MPPAALEPAVDAGETTTVAWVQPAQALQQHADGAFPMEFATVNTVRSLLPFAGRDVAALLAYAAAQHALPPLHPRLLLDAQRHVTGVRLPGGAGYTTPDGDAP